MMAFSRTHQLRDSIMNMIAAPHCSTGSYRCWVEVVAVANPHRSGRPRNKWTVRARQPRRTIAAIRSRRFEQRRCRANVENVLCRLTANLLRVTRGAGRAHEIAQQAIDFLKACKESHAQVGYYPAAEFPQMLDTAPELDRPDLNHAVHRIVSGALQIIASRLLDQKTQERAREDELYNGIRALERARAESRARLMGKRND
jgi:hypothetical protein